jgi:hypothetical protein
VIPLAEARAARAAATRVPFYRRPGFQRFAAQVLLVVGIGTGVVLFSDRAPHRAPATPEAQYRVLGDAAQPAEGANAIVRFAPGADTAPALAVARAAGADVVTAPGEGGMARLSIAPSRRNAVLERLRAQPGVVMAEPLDGARP